MIGLITSAAAVIGVVLLGGHEKLFAASDAGLLSIMVGAAASGWLSVFAAWLIVGLPLVWAREGMWRRLLMSGLVGAAAAVGAGLLVVWTVLPVIILADVASWILAAAVILCASLAAMTAGRSILSMWWNPLATAGVLATIGIGSALSVLFGLSGTGASTVGAGVAVAAAGLLDAGRGPGSRGAGTMGSGRWVAGLLLLAWGANGLDAFVGMVVMAVIA